MYKRILVPVDGSQTALQAVGSAIAVAKAFQADLHLVSVIDPYPFTGVPPDFAFGQSQYLNLARSEASNAIEAAREQIEAAGLAVQTHVLENHRTWRGILDTAQDVHADLIVMGSHGRHGLEKLILGSVTQAVLQRAQLSVLVVRGEQV